MKYPKFLNNNSTIGICAPSMGVGRKIDSFNKSLSNLKKYYKLIETNSVRNNGLESNTPIIRAKEFNDLINNKNIDMIWCATGGEILMDMLPYIDYDNISNNIKWIQGYSDPTSILYIITTKLDIATIYGINAGGLDMDILDKSLEYNLNLLQGKLSNQSSFKYFEPLNNKSNGNYNLTEKVKWLSNKKEINLEGRLIGGCIDSLNDIIGTCFDYTESFISKYMDDGIIWYFDIYSMPSIQVYRTLLHMKYIGWFKYSKCFIFGRVLLPNEDFISYYEAITKVLEDTPFIMDADIGHTNPKMTLINGSISKINYKNNTGSIETIIQQ